ncbi:MAG: nucleotidyltransferase domain-containing protein [Cyanobacteria bacterium K_Offshore_surface_m2_239]|nr:nucleotidyltransferase domain-containing protein [Cyanobacteria bacterium K_Offshore_surface_m2_239]
MTTTPARLVTREALRAFTRRLVECYAPEKVILFGSLARGEGSWDSDADILVVMPFEGRHLAKIRDMRRLCPVRFPLDLLVRRPEEIEVRYRGGIRSCAKRSTMARCCMAEAWSASSSPSDPQAG